MRISLLLIGLLTGLASASSLAQPVGRGGGGVPPPDSMPTNPAAYGAPGSTESETEEYLHQRALNNLPHASKAEADTRASKLGRERAAKPSELVVGASVNDQDGVPVAKIESVDPDGVVLSNGSQKVKVPASAFGRNRAGLVVDVTKAQFDAIVAKANAGS